jgi:hypothetical protein
MKIPCKEHVHICHTNFAKKKGMKFALNNWAVENISKTIVF